jgi:hypothetical protein
MAEARAEGSGVSKETKPAGSLTRGAGRGSPRLGRHRGEAFTPGQVSDPRSMFLHRAEACVGPVRVQGCGYASTAPTPSLLVTVCAPSGPAVQSPCSGGFALKGVPMSIPDSGSSRRTSAEIIERANRTVEEATAQCKRIEAWLAEREAPERRQSFTLIQGGRDESDDA